MQTTVTVYPLQNYSFGSKDRKADKDVNLEARLQRYKTLYERDGLRRTVEGLLVVQEHNHPHVLMLQAGANYFKLPGGRLRPGEDEVEGLKRKLTNSLSPTSHLLQTPWDVGECAGTFWRPTFMDNSFYPYVPVHITRPKECKKIYLVPLPDKAMFAVPRNYRLVAVPLFELYDNTARYGPVLSSVPLLLSRYRLNLVQSLGNPVAPPAQAPGATGANHSDHTQQQQQNHQQRATVGA